MEKNWTRVPLETAKRSDACASAFEGDNGAEMWVIGLIDGEGARICKVVRSQYYQLWTSLKTKKETKGNQLPQILSHDSEHSLQWEGMRDSKARTWELKVFQYVCSGVRGEGPGASLTGWRGKTGADMSVTSPVEEGFIWLISPCRLDRGVFLQYDKADAGKRNQFRYSPYTSVQPQIISTAKGSSAPMVGQSISIVYMKHSRASLRRRLRLLLYPGDPSRVYQYSFCPQDSHHDYS